MDAAQRLGDVLLSRTELTASQVKAAVVDARAERVVEDRRAKLRRLTTQIALLGRLPGRDEPKWLAELSRLAQEILEAAK